MNKPKLPQKEFLFEHQIQKLFKEIDNFQVEIDSVNYDESLIKGYDRVIITGPQRSGTTFVCEAIAQTLGFKAVDEGIYVGRNRDGRTQRFICNTKDKNIVVQAPTMVYNIHTLVGENDLVIFMKRKWSDIVKSLYRIAKQQRPDNHLSNWISMNTMYDIEKYHWSLDDSKCREVYEEVVDRNSYYLDAPYKMWKNYLVKNIPNSITLNYESMKSHPMWIDKKDRESFSQKQIRK